MAYWKLKGCSRCHGDMFVEKGEHNSTAYCLQCGSRSYIMKKPQVERPSEQQHRELVAAQ